jgi:hypothetical protein
MPKESPAHDQEKSDPDLIRMKARLSGTIMLAKDLERNRFNLKWLRS